MAYVPAPQSGSIIQALGSMNTRPFSASRFIGGKLRALYDEGAQPCPARLDELLNALNTDRPEPPKPTR
jgi:hypothetical protein